jgi:surfactin synthase thioesterase subunit
MEVDPAIEICPVQLPGRERRLRERPFTAMEPLVAALAEALVPLLDRPFAFFGHSLGAWVGFELARYLRATSGPQPVQLFVAGSRAPHLPFAAPSLHDLPHEEFVAALGRLGGTPKEVLRDPELMALFEPVLRADFAIADSYTFRCEEPLACPISAFGGMADTLATPTSIAAWSALSRGRFRQRIVPGGHFFIREERAMVLAGIHNDLGRWLM